MIKKLAKSIREYTAAAVMSPVFILIEVGFDTLIPLLMAKLIDNGIEKGDMDYVTRMGVILFFVALLALGAGAMSSVVSSKATAGFAKNLRHDMFHKVQEFSFENIDRFSSASIITRLTTDVARVQQAFMMSLRMAVRAPLNLVFALIMAISINSEIAVIYAVALPFLATVLILIGRSAHPIFTEVFKTYDGLNNVVKENLHGIRVVKSFVREDYEIEKFSGISRIIYKLFMKAERRLAVNFPIMMVTVNTCILTIAWLGAKLITVGSMTTGNLTSLIAYTFQMLTSLMMLSMIFVMLIMSRASAERIIEILDEESTMQEKEDPVMEVKDGSVSFRGVSFSYSNDPEHLSLRDIDLDIASGETIGIIGGTGSGKSSLVQLIPRLYDVTEGSVTVGGVDVRDYHMDTLRDQVAMVLQKNELFSGTIKDNLRWGNPDATDEEIMTACRHAQASEFIESFPDGYDTMLEQGGSNVSGGQKQRLCIARALLKKPKILILDDSTSAVDTQTDARIRKAFREDLPDTTKFIIAQRVSSIMDADRIIVLNEGTIDGFGTHEELLKNNRIYSQVYTSQTQGGGLANE
ncbi:MAG: ABC transporter ATP-binding protein/permease [Eubacteriales bacterium]|nr:ABC transporter ATP-binding protein/permease [Eubacteriales bacterium]